MTPRRRAARAPGSDDIVEREELLGGAVELAVAQARRDLGAPGAPPPPAALRPVLRFTRLPRAALRTVQDVLDSDPEFRARVAEAADEDSVGRASWLFLTRPEGWQEELDLLIAAASEAVEDRRSSRKEQRAERRAAQLEGTVQQLRTELDELRSGLDQAERDTVAQRAARLEAERERERLIERVDQLESERAKAVRSLKDTEATAVARLEELRAVRGRLAEALERERGEATAFGEVPGPTSGEAPPHTAATTAGGQRQDAEPPGPAETGRGPTATAAQGPPASSPWDRGDPVALAEAVRQASEAAGTLAQALASAVDALGGLVEQQGTVEPSERAPSAGASAGWDPDALSEAPERQRPPRRTPLRLRQGVHEGTVEGLEQLLATPGVVAVVDGYNVSQEGWPNLDASAQRASLISALGAIRQRTRSDIHVVFDGDAEGGRPAVGAPLPVRVHFSPAEIEADDVILGMVADLPTDVPVVVVSSDRRVADGARRLGANAVRSRQLLELIRR